MTAFVRSRDRIDAKLLSSSNLTAVEGDILVKNDVDHAFSTAANNGHIDAVISTISEGLEIKTHLQSKGSRIILDAINARSGKKPRFILFAGAGMVDAPQQSSDNSGKEAPLMKTTPYLPEMFRPVADEHEITYNAIRKLPDLEWTMLCPPSITDDPADGQYLVAKSVLPSQTFHIKAGNLAHFVVKELSEGKFIRQRVGITDA